MQIKSSKHFRPQRKAPVLWADGTRGTKDGEPPVPDKDGFAQNTLGFGVGMAANIAATAYPSTWMHEMGHAKMIEVMYDGVKPEVEIFPFKGGVTRWRLGPLSDVGQKFGHDGARAMVAAAGTMVDMGVAGTAFGVGFKMRKEHPIVGTALMGYAGATVINSIGYAASAVGKDLVKLSMEGNDFATLGVKAGIHPIVSIALMAALLPLEYAVLKYLEDN